jgi:uncharacterized RDD family membrane protein YckC
METMYSAAETTTTDLFLEEPVVHGTFWERFAAAFIDGLILIIPNYALQFALGSVGSVLFILLAWLYSAYMESGTNQATIGKKAMGLKVTTVDGHRLSFGQATARHFGKFISAIILLIGYFMMLWDEKKQTLHDKMAGAFVVKR